MFNPLLLVWSCSQITTSIQKNIYTIHNPFRLTVQSHLPWGCRTMSHYSHSPLGWAPPPATEVTQRRLGEGWRASDIRGVGPVTTVEELQKKQRETNYSKPKDNIWAEWTRQRTDVFCPAIVCEQNSRLCFMSKPLFVPLPLQCRWTASFSL